MGISGPMSNFPSGGNKPADDKPTKEAADAAREESTSKSKEAKKAKDDASSSRTSNAKFQSLVHYSLHHAGEEAQQEMLNNMLKAFEKSESGGGLESEPEPEPEPEGDPENPLAKGAKPTKDGQQKTPGGKDIPKPPPMSGKPSTSNFASGKTPGWIHILNIKHPQHNEVKKTDKQSEGEEVAEDSGEEASVAKSGTKAAKKNAAAKAHQHSEAENKERQSALKSKETHQTQASKKSASSQQESASKHAASAKQAQMQGRSSAQTKESEEEKQPSLLHETKKSEQEKQQVNEQNAKQEKIAKEALEERSSSSKKAQAEKEASAQTSAKAKTDHAHTHDEKMQQMQKGAQQEKPVKQSDEQAAQKAKNMQQMEQQQKASQLKKAQHESSSERQAQAQSQNQEASSENKTHVNQGTLSQIASQLKKEQQAGKERSSSPEQKGTKTGDLRASQVVQDSSGKDSSDQEPDSQSQKQQAEVKQQEAQASQTFTQQQAAKEKTKRQNQAQQDSIVSINTLAASEYAASRKKLNVDYLYGPNRIAFAKKIGLRTHQIVQGSSDKEKGGGNQGGGGQNQQHRHFFDPYEHLTQEAKQKAQEVHDLTMLATLDAHGIDEHSSSLLEANEPLDLRVESDPLHTGPEGFLEGIHSSLDFSSEDDTSGIFGSQGGSHSGNPFAKRKAISTGDVLQADTTLPHSLDSSSQKSSEQDDSGFSLFPDSYKMRSGDSLTLETEATTANYEYEKESTDHSDRMNELQIKAQEYSSYANDYLQDVHGYRLHAFDGTSNFTNDLSPLRKTPQYQEWLNKLQKYQDDYLSAKTELNDFEGVYQGAKTSYNLAYDQTELFVKLSSEAHQEYSKIDYKGLEKEIHSLEQAIQSNGKSANGCWSKMLSQLAKDKTALEKYKNDEERKEAAASTQAKKTADQALIKATENKIQAISNATQSIQSLESAVSQKLKNGEPIPISEINTTISEINSELTPPDAFKSALSEISSFSKDINMYHTAQQTLASKKAELIKHMQTYFNSLASGIHQQIVIVDAQAKKYGSITSDKNPLHKTLELLNSMYSGAKTDSRGTTISGLWKKVEKTNTGIVKLKSSLCTPSALRSYQKKAKAWQSAQAGMIQYVSKLKAAKRTLDDQGTFPPLERYVGGFSPYGKAMEYLEKFHLEMANIKALSPSFNEFQRVAAGKPKLVDVGPIGTTWAAMINYIDKIPWDIADIAAASAALAAAIAATVTSCGIIGGGVLIAAASVALAEAVKAYKKLKDVTIPGASTTYLGTVATLVDMQDHNDTLWHNKLSMLSQQVEQQISQDITKTQLKRQRSEKKMGEQERNMQLIMKTALSIVQHKRQNTTSYL